MQPIVIVNAKTYPRACGEDVLKYVRHCDEVAVETGAHIGLAVQSLDLRLAKNTLRNAFVYAQHVDPGEPGRNTGSVLASNVRDLGITHTLLNHSEHKIPLAVLKKTLAECETLGITTVVCAENVKEIGAIAKLRPNFIAYEPPELIGGKVSVSDAKPGVITKAVEAAKGIDLLVGAGIHTKHDVQVALEHGAVGVLVASGVILHKNPKKELLSLTLS